MVEAATAEGSAEGGVRIAQQHELQTAQESPAENNSKSSSQRSGSFKRKYFLPRVMAPPSTISIPFLTNSKESSRSSSNGGVGDTGSSVGGENSTARVTASQQQQQHKQQRRRSSTGKKLRNKVQAINSGASVSSTATPTNVASPMSPSKRIYSALMNGSGIGGSHRRSSFSNQQQCGMENQAGATTGTSRSLNTTMDSTATALSASAAASALVEDDDMSGIIDPQEEELLEKLGAMVGKRLSALAAMATHSSGGSIDGSNHDDGSYCFSASGSTNNNNNMANDAFLKRLAMISYSAVNAASMGVNGNGSSHNNTNGMVRSGSGHSLTQLCGDNNGFNGSFSNFLSDNGSIYSASQLSYNSFISGANIDQKTHSELVLSLERSRDKIQQQQVDLATEKQRRKNREKSLVKLAKELTKYKQQLQENEDATEMLQNEIRYMKNKFETYQKDMDREIKKYNELQSQMKSDRDVIVMEREETHMTLMEEHEKRIQELKTNHAKQCEELCSEIISANQEVARLTKLLEKQQLENPNNSNEMPTQQQSPERREPSDDEDNQYSPIDPKDVELEQQQWQQEQQLQQERLQQTTKRYPDSEKQQRKTRTLSWKKSQPPRNSEQQRSVSWKAGDGRILSGGIVGGNVDGENDNSFYYDGSNDGGGTSEAWCNLDSATSSGDGYDQIAVSSKSRGRLRLFSLKKLSRRQRRRRLIVLVVIGVLLAYWAISKNGSTLLPRSLLVRSSQTTITIDAGTTSVREPPKSWRRSYLHDAVFVNMESTVTIAEVKPPSADKVRFAKTDNVAKQQQQSQFQRGIAKASTSLAISPVSNTEALPLGPTSARKKLIAASVRQVESASTPSLTEDIDTPWSSPVNEYRVIRKSHRVFFARILRGGNGGWKLFWSRLIGNKP